MRAVTVLLAALLLTCVALPLPALAMQKGIVKDIAKPSGTIKVTAECDVPVPDGTDLSVPGSGCSVANEGAPGAAVPVGNELQAELPGIAGLSLVVSLGGGALVVVCGLDAAGQGEQCAQDVPLPL